MKNKITIVGPKPEKRSSQKHLEGANFEALLLMAKYNKSFRKQLMANRTKAIQLSGLKLDEKEKFILQNIDNKQLQSTIRSFNIKGINKKSLANWKTAAAVLLLITTVSTKEVKSQAVSMDTSNTESTPIVQGFTSESFYMLVKGKVFNAGTHDPISNVRVTVKGRVDTVETNENGKYTIRAIASDTLVFEHEGYLKKEVVYYDVSDIDVALEEYEIQMNSIARGITPEPQIIQIEEKKKKKRK